MNVCGIENLRAFEDFVDAKRIMRKEFNSCQGATYSFAIVFTLSRTVGYVSFSFLYRNI